MSTYATQQDLVDRFGSDELIQLTDRSSSGTIDATVVDQALSDASDEMDGYIGARYELPLPSTPNTLVRVCADIARYRLYDIQAPEAVAQRYKDAVAFLKAVSTGAVALGLPTASQPSSAGAPQKSAPSPVFGGGRIDDYQGWDYGKGK
ncbi:MAG TPA: DUF1320 domain-containing protein [Gammaproteobacteria bacterium]|nr:DUF1320 domain-containing protein [Gammaproteobacteria bacterium]